MAREAVALMDGINVHDDGVIVYTVGGWSILSLLNRPNDYATISDDHGLGGVAIESL